MNKNFKKVSASKISISQLMLPSHTNFSGKIHGGFILSLMDQIAFACASKFSGHYCVTASVDTVNFLKPIEVGELITLKASVNYIGKSSMIIGIRVEAENIQKGTTKHCISSYFTMVSQDKQGLSVAVPGLILSNMEEVRRFSNGLNQIALKKERNNHKEAFDYSSKEIISNLSKYNVLLDLDK